MMQSKKKKIVKTLKKNKNTVDTVIIIATFIVFAIAMVFVTIYVSFDTVGNSKYFDKYNLVLKNELSSIINNQSKIDAKIEDISLNGGYTFEDAFVYNNPYGLSPLSSLIIFNTESEVGVTIYINDNLVTTIEPTTHHIVPIYGLYANATNLVTLTLSSGESKTFEISTESLNDYIYEYDLSQNLGDKRQIFIIGDLYQNQLLRGFDNHNNLIFYLDLNNINGLVFHKDHYYVSYNSENSYNNLLKNIKLEMDYLGRIYSIDKNLDEVLSAENLTIENGKNYIMEAHNMYYEITANYILSELIDNYADTSSTKIATKDIDEELTNAKLYDKEYKLAINGDYISYQFNEDIADQRLVLVNKSDSYAYQYVINTNNIIKVSKIREASLYLYLDGEYYNLLATYEN